MASTLATVTLHTHYPCHPQSKVRIAALVAVPRESYDRQCPTCLTKWTVERTTLKEHAVDNLGLCHGDTRIDKLEWSRT